MLEMDARDYIPAVSAYIGDLSRNIKDTEAVLLAGAPTSFEREHLIKLSELLSDTYAAHRALSSASEQAVAIENTEQAAFYYCTDVERAMADLRHTVDSLEVITARDYWPVPTYGDMTYREIL